MRIFDISVPIAPGVTPVYPGDPGIEIESWSSISNGDGANVSRLLFSTHTATHVDTPAHFIEGAAPLADLSLDIFIGEAQVVEIPAGVRAIEATHLAAHDTGGITRVLFKTRNSAFWENSKGHFREDYTYLAPDAARTLVTRGVRLVGIDYLSIEQFNPVRFETHLILLSNGVVIVEGLNLREVPAGVYELICLPLKIASGSGDGAPARAILRAWRRTDAPR